MSTLKTTNITHGSNSGTANMVLAADGGVTIPEKKLYCPGGIVQVVQNLITDAHSEAIATTNWGSLGGFSDTAITPTSASSKILVSGWMSVGISAAMNVYLRLRRGSTVIAEADSVGSRREGLAAGAPNDTNKIDSIPFFYIDGPSTTSATTYSVQLTHPSSSSRTIYINRDHDDGSGVEGCRVCSSIVLQEVAA